MKSNIYNTKLINITVFWVWQLYVLGWREEIAPFIFSSILRQKFQNKNSEFIGRHNETLDYDNNMLLFKIKIFEGVKISISFIDWHELLKL